jgi:hypothetical protein
MVEFDVDTLHESQVTLFPCVYSINIRFSKANQWKINRIDIVGK